MPTHCPQEGLSGLNSGETLTPEQNNAREIPQTGKLARLATHVAKRVGPIITAAGLLTATQGCNQATSATASDIAPDSTPENASKEDPTVGAKLVCQNLGLIDSNTQPAAKNFRRMFVQTIVAGQPVLYEPCAESTEPRALGKFVQANCKTDGQYRNCIVKGSYVDNSYNVVNTETRVKWLLNGYNNVESAQTVGYIFPFDLITSNGTVIDKTAPLIFGQQMLLGRQQPVTPTTAPHTTTIQLKPPVPRNQESIRMDNLESQVAQNNARLNEHARIIDNNSKNLELYIRSNNQPAHTPNPTNADYDAQGRKAATGANR